MKDLIKLQQQLAQASQPDKRTKLLGMYDEYNSLPPQVQRDLTFSNFIDFHPKLQHKTVTAKRQYHELAQDLLA